VHLILHLQFAEVAGDPALEAEAAPGRTAIVQHQHEEPLLGQALIAQVHGHAPGVDDLLCVRAAVHVHHHRRTLPPRQPARPSPPTPPRCPAASPRGRHTAARIVPPTRALTVRYSAGASSSSAMRGPAGASACSRANSTPPRSRSTVSRGVSMLVNMSTYASN